MKILLINNNPVVSRLTALSARKENIAIDEIQEVTELSSSGYDIVFVDADSLTKDVNDIIKEQLKVKKSVLFYAEGDEEDKSLFDLTILKPFLPSEVSAVIRSVEEMEQEEEEHFNILDEPKVSEPEELFELNELVEIKDEPVVAKTEDSFDKKLEEAFPLKINTLDDDLFVEQEESSSNDKVSKKDEELFDLDISDDKLTLDDELFAKEVIPSSEILDFESNTDELKLDELKKEEAPLILEEEPLMVLEDDKEKIEALAEEIVEKDKVEEKIEANMTETKILDKSEVENIKGLLTEETTEEMTLDDLMTPPMIVRDSEEKEEEKEQKSKKKEEKEEDSPLVESNALVESLSSLSVGALRELLAGAEVNINIKFPEAK